MGSALHCLLLFSALWTLSLCGTRQFHVVNINKTWSEAQKYCREKFTDLATIENQEEMNAVKAALNGTKGHFWIGLRQNPDQNKSWTWPDGSNSSYSDWNTGEPNNNGTDNCVELWSESEYKWNDAGCHYLEAFVCYTGEPTTQLAQGSTASTGMGAEIPLILIKEKKTWWGALEYCQRNHTNLVSVHTEDIQHWVEIATRNASTDNVWMGLRHTSAMDFWFWVSGEFLCYENWAPGNGTGVEDCSNGERSGAVQSGSKKWVSLLENQTLNFICHKK